MSTNSKYFRSPRPAHTGWVTNTKSVDNNNNAPNIEKMFKKYLEYISA